jgi:hypothetical protein
MGDQPFFKENAKSKVATETATKDNMAMVAGETTTQAKIDCDKIEDNPWSPWEDVDDKTCDASSSHENPYLRSPGEDVEGHHADSTQGIMPTSRKGIMPTSRVAGRMPTSRKGTIPIIKEPCVIKPRGSVAPFLADIVRPPFFKKL